MKQFLGNFREVFFMQMTTISTRLRVSEEALAFDLDRLYAVLKTVPDQRDRRGCRYALADLLLNAVLARLAGQDSSRAIAHWARLRQHELSRLFQL
jgi:hypothetical protein